jgi:DNA-binding transcriptional LysR family regulator
VDSRRLKCFIAVSEELNFGRAANRVHLSQPAVSLQVKALEQELGVQLFLRTKRRVALTQAGTLFYREAYDLLRHTEAVVSSIRRLDTAGPRKFIIGSTAPGILCLAPTIVSALKKRLPDNEFSIAYLSTDAQEQALIDGTIDAGIVHPPMTEKSIQLLPIGSSPFSLVLPKSHKLARQPSISLADLREEPLILFPREISPWIYDKIIGLCLKAGFTAQIRHEVTPAQMIMGLVAADQGLGLVIDPFKRLAPDGVIFRPIAGEPILLDFAVATTGGAHSSFAKILRSTILSANLAKHLS